MFKALSFAAMSSLVSSKYLILVDQDTAKPQSTAINLDNLRSDALQAPLFAVPADSSMKISVKSAPSTGYVWSYKSNCGAQLDEVSNLYQAGDSLLGASGSKIWTFNTPAKADGVLTGTPCKVRFYEHRPWMQISDSDVPDKTITILVE